MIKPSSLGDVVHALPVLHGLRARYPAAKIDWLIGSAFAPLLEGHGELDDLILFDRTRYGRVGRSLQVTRQFATFLHDLRARRYDLVIDLQGLFRTGFLTWASGARVRIGFRDTREGAWVFYTDYVGTGSRDPDQHAVDRNYDVARLLGFQDVRIRFDLSLTESDRAEALSLIRQAGLPDGRGVLAVVPGARWETKVWLPARFAEVIDTLHGERGLRSMLLGGPDEVGLCHRIADASRSGPVNLAGRTTVRQLAGVIGLADVVLCHDSAAMHLAVALDRPLVCVIGPTNPHRTGPYRRLGDVVRLKLDCAPCYLRRLSQCRNNHRCMRDIETVRVVSALQGAITG